MNFNNTDDAPPPLFGGGGGGGSGTGGANYGLVRQPSVYSLTFEEFQNSLGGARKDFGSMNMDEFLKNIWTAEEFQATTTSTTAEGGGGGGQVGGLLRQGSLTLPRTLSQKTVDEVWRDLFEGGSKDGGNETSGPNLPQRQPTMGEMTLEEFLARAGVVREDTQVAGRSGNNRFFGELFGASGNSGGLVLGFGEPDPRNGSMLNRVVESRNFVPVPIQSHNPGINVNGVGASQQPQQKHQRQLVPKQPSMTYSHAHLASQSTRDRNGGVGDPTVKCLAQSVRLESGFVSFGAGGVKIAAASPGNPQSSDGIGKSTGEMSLLSPAPFAIGDLRVRRCSAAVDKVVERRQRRMIKNRESASRSRARKQAITVELEEKVADLRRQNEELKKKQEEILDFQKNQILKAMIQQKFAKKRHLRRTLTGPW